MMRSLRPAVLVVAGLLLLPAAGRARKLDDDDKRFLNDVLAGDTPARGVFRRP